MAARVWKGVYPYVLGRSCQLSLNKIFGRSKQLLLNKFFDPSTPSMGKGRDGGKKNGEKKGKDG